VKTDFTMSTSKHTVNTATYTVFQKKWTPKTGWYRGKWVTAVKNGELSLREASQVYSIPKSTLERHKNKKVSKPGSLGRFECVLDQDFEKELVAYCVEMQQRLFGLSLAELRHIAYELAERNKLPHPFSRDKKLAGKD